MNLLRHREFGDVITSYDLLKTFAIVFMIVDHIGAYILLDNDILRVLGRLCVPVWFFLIGYANTRDIPRDWLIGALILIASTLALEERILPVNIILTMIILRLIIDHIAPLFMKNLPNFIALTVLCGFLSLIAGKLTDYGTLAIPLAMLGYAARRGQLGWPHLLAAGYVFYAAQIIMFDFTPFEKQLLLALLPLPFLLCYVFKPLTLGMNPPGIVRFPLQLMGRRTLEIYVGHIILFQLVGNWLLW